jgi:hypothetical protein
MARSDTSALEAFAAPASASVIVPASLALTLKVFIDETTSTAASDRSSPPAAARFIVAASAPPLIWAGVKPPLARFSIAPAASPAEKVVLAPISSA